MKRTSMMTRAVGLAWLSAALGVLAGNVSESVTQSNVMPMDVRNRCKELIATGTVRVSDRDEVQHQTVLFGVDGRAVSKWSGKNPDWNSTVAKNGLHDVYLKAGITYSYSSLLVLNEDVLVHGGALASDEVWEAGKVHVLAHWVRIPEGMTLTVADGAVVKFSDHTGIRVDGTLKADNAVFTALSDDTVGGNTDGKNPTGTFEYDTYAFSGDGVRDVNGCDVRFLSVLPFDVTWKKGRVYPVCGTVTVPDGITLTMEEGAIVKFAGDSRLSCGNGGKILTAGAVFTHIHDDSIGGDTDMDEGVNKPVYGDFTFDGFIPDVMSDLHYYLETYSEKTIGRGETMTFVPGAIISLTGDLVIEDGGRLDMMAGAVVKLADGKSIVVREGGVLTAKGIVGKEVHVTSVHDDSIGGDIDGDEGAREPAAGDWKVIEVNGSADIFRTVVSYGGASTGALDCGAGCKVTVNASRIDRAANECVHVTGGSVTLDNSIFTEAPAFGSCSAEHALKVRNCIVTEVQTGNKGRWTTFVNTIFYKVGSFAAPGCESTGYSCCLFYNPENEGEQASAAVGKNGNIWADPLFRDAAAGDYAIDIGSPCVDAGDGVNGAERDCNGAVRMDVKTVEDTGVANAEGVCPDIGLHEVDGRSLFFRSYSLKRGWNVLALPQAVASDKPANRTLWDDIAPKALNEAGCGYKSAQFPGEGGMVVWIYAPAGRNVVFSFWSDEAPEMGVTRKKAMYQWVVVGVKGTEDVEVEAAGYDSIWRWDGSRWQYVAKKDGVVSLAHEAGYFAAQHLAP